MKKAEFFKIIELYESHLQVKKLTSPGTIRTYLHSVKIFYTFCRKYNKELVLPDKWDFKNLGIRELEAFLKHQVDIMKFKRSTLVTCVSGIKSLMNFLAESNYLTKNPIQHFKLPRILSEISQQRFDINQINKLFKSKIQNSLDGLQQRLLLELIYGLGMPLSKITKIKSVLPELDSGTVRFYFENSRFQDFPFNQSSINILKSYLKLVDCIEERNSFWVNKKGNKMNTVQLQNLLNKYFESHNIASISANELRDLSVIHFSQNGADIRSIQSLRKFKQLRRLQSINTSDFSQLKKIIKHNHIRNNIYDEN